MTDFRIGVLTLAPDNFLWNVLVLCRYGVLQGSTVVAVVTPTFRNSPAYDMAGEYRAAQIVLSRGLQSERFAEAVRQGFGHHGVDLVIDCRSCYLIPDELREWFGGNWLRIVQPQQLPILLASLAMRERVSQRL